MLALHIYVEGQYCHLEMTMEYLYCTVVPFVMSAF